MGVSQPYLIGCQATKISRRSRINAARSTIQRDPSRQKTSQNTIETHLNTTKPHRNTAPEKAPTDGRTDDLQVS
jgi:hypothetical protein